MKRIFILLLVSCFLFLFACPCFAYDVYGSVTENTSQIQVLINALLNDPAFNIFSNWQAARVGDYDYYLWFNINDDGECSYYRYHGLQSGYNVSYVLERGEAADFVLQRIQYTTVGNTFGDLSSSIYRSFVFQLVLKYSIVFIVLLCGFYVFRIHKRNGGIAL